MTKELSDRVITIDEDCYGFLVDLIQDLEYNLEADLETGGDGAILKEALDEAKKLYEDDDNDDKIFHLIYHPMGAIIFEKLVPEK